MARITEERLEEKGLSLAPPHKHEQDAVRPGILRPAMNTTVRGEWALYKTMCFVCFVCRMNIRQVTGVGCFPFVQILCAAAPATFPLKYPELYSSTALSFVLLYTNYYCIIVIRMLSSAPDRVS